MDQEHLATELLRGSNALGAPATVANISAGSWGPGNWLAYAQEFGFFNADVVVLVLSSHDIADNPTFDPLDPQTHPQVKPVLALIEGVMRYMPRYLPNFRQAPAKIGSSSPTTKDNAAIRIAIERGSADLRSFLNLAMANAPTVMLLNPTQIELENEHEPGRALITTIGLEENVPLATLDSALLQEIKQGVMPYRVNIHGWSAGALPAVTASYRWCKS